MASGPVRLARPPQQTPGSFTWDPAMVLWVERLIERSWKRVRQYVRLKGPVRETKLNTLLRREILKELDKLEAKGNQSFFTMVTSSEEVPDYKGSLVENKPDLVVRIDSYRHQWHRWNALFIECKVLSKSATLSAYGVDGMTRFVKGKYAWTMTHAMMLGYCVGPDHLANNARSSLDRYLSRSKLKRSLINTSACDLGSKAKRHLVVTEHERAFKLGSHAFQNIKLRHMWLQAR